MQNLQGQVCHPSRVIMLRLVWEQEGCADPGAPSRQDNIQCRQDKRFFLPAVFLESPLRSFFTSHWLGCSHAPF